MKRIISLDKSVIPACDVGINKYEEILRETADINKVGAYKIGPALTGRPGYDKIVGLRNNYSSKPLIFDAQKWGTDIPDTAEPILTPLRDSGIEAVILFPESGPITEYEWIKTAQNLGLGVIVGGEMTHPRYLEEDLSEGKKKNYTEIFKELGIERNIGGFIRQSAPEDIYEIAARMGVTDFVVPGNKPHRITFYRELITNCGVAKPTFYSPGLVEQGGEISEGAKAAGKRFHGIVGRGITKAEDIRQAALDLTMML